MAKRLAQGHSLSQDWNWKLSGPKLGTLEERGGSRHPVLAAKRPEISLWVCDFSGGRGLKSWFAGRPDPLLNRFAPEGGLKSPLCCPTPKM